MIVQRDLVLLEGHKERHDCLRAGLQGVGRLLEGVGALLDLCPGRDGAPGKAGTGEAARTGEKVEKNDEAGKTGAREMENSLKAV